MKLEVIDCIKNYFLTDKMKFGQAINLSQLKYEILGKAGVIGVQTLELSQFINGRHFKSLNALGSPFPGNQAQPGYGFEYSFESALENETIRPSVTPAVFELRNPNQDIYGRVL